MQAFPVRKEDSAALAARRDLALDRFPRACRAGWASFAGTLSGGSAALALANPLLLDPSRVHRTSCRSCSQPIRRAGADRDVKRSMPDGVTVVA